MANRAWGRVTTSILVVDDDATLRELVAETLEENGYAVAMAEDGREALDILERAPPNGIVTDLMMPRVDGVTLCSKVKNNPATNAIVVIVMSASHQIERKLRGCPVDAILPKPFELADLVHLLNKHLSPSASAVT
jgi:CheY-like chemotaxis protein